MLRQSSTSTIGGALPPAVITVRPSNRPPMHHTPSLPAVWTSALLLRVTRSLDAEATDGKLAAQITDDGAVLATSCLVRTRC